MDVIVTALRTYERTNVRTGRAQTVKVRQVGAKVFCTNKRPSSMAACCGAKGGASDESGQKVCVGRERLPELHDHNASRAMTERQRLSKDVSRGKGFQRLAKVFTHIQ